MRRRQALCHSQDEVLQLVRSRQLVQKWASDDGASWLVPESGCGTCSSGPQNAQAASLVAKERKVIAIPLLHVNVSLCEAADNQTVL